MKHAKLTLSLTLISSDVAQNGVFVLDVFSDGAAGKDGRLQPGDRIVDINKESFKAMDSEKAYQTVLRITQGPVSIYFENKRHSRRQRSECLL